MRDRKLESSEPREQARLEKRRFPRWRASGWLSGWIGDAIKVSVVDISMGGVLIEHSYVILSGTICILTLSLCGTRVSVKCRVVRSALHRYEVWPVEGRNYVYRTGLELADVSEGSQQLISGYIEFLRAKTAGY